MSFSFSLFLPLVFFFPCRRSKRARMPETPCLFGNQTAVFLKCAEIDCALESAKKPRTAGLCGRAAGACDCGPLSCAKIERANLPPKAAKTVSLRRAPDSRERGVFSPSRAGTLPAPERAHTTAHRANSVGKRGSSPVRHAFESTKTASSALSHDHLLLLLAGIERYA